MADPHSSDGYLIELAIGAVGALWLALVGLAKIGRDDLKSNQGQLVDLIERRIEADHEMKDAVKELAEEQRQTRQFLMTLSDASGRLRNNLEQH